VELALGHVTASEEDAGALRHIEQCERCRDQLRTMTRVVTAARTAQLVDLPAAPPERVWQRITHDLSHRPPAPRASGDHTNRDRLLVAVLAVTALGAAVTVLAAAVTAAHRARRLRVASGWDHAGEQRRGRPGRADPR
jgi:hypothetical protein